MCEDVVLSGTQELVWFFWNGWQISNFLKSLIQTFAYRHLSRSFWLSKFLLIHLLVLTFNCYPKSLSLVKRLGIDMTSDEVQLSIGHRFKSSSNWSFSLVLRRTWLIVLTFCLVLNCMHLLNNSVFCLHEVDSVCVLNHTDKCVKQLSVVRCTSVLILAYREEQRHHWAYFIFQESLEFEVVRKGGCVLTWIYIASN